MIWENLLRQCIIDSDKLETREELQKRLGISEGETLKLLKEAARRGILIVGRVARTDVAQRTCIKPGYRLAGSEGQDE